MKFFQPSPELAPFGLRAMVMIAKAADGGMDQPQRAMLDAAQKIILKTDINIDELTPITPEELATKFNNPDLAGQLIKGMVVISLANGPTNHTQSELISSFASALKVDEPAVKNIHYLAEQETLIFRMDFYRRSNLRDYMKEQYRTQGGFLGVVKAVLGVKGLVEDKELAARFHNLSNLPEDTLGYHLYRHYIDNGFGFPGEKKGFPLGGVFHDLGHVLGGYNTSPEGEMKTAALQAGYRRSEDAFFTMLFALLIHTTGVNMAPIPMPVMVGRIREGDLAEQVLIALKRGSAMTFDLGAEWDFWPYLELPIETVRQQFGIKPLSNS